MVMMTEEAIRLRIVDEESNLKAHESCPISVYDRKCPEMLIGSAAVYVSALSRVNAFKEVLGEDVD